MVKPFTINIPQAKLTELRKRLEGVHFPDAPKGAGWGYGTDMDYMKSLVKYWKDDFDWRRSRRQFHSLRRHIRRAKQDRFGVVVPHQHVG